MENKVIRASFDRIEGQFAVVYTDDGDHQKIDVPLELVGDAKPGARLRIHIEDDKVTSVVEIDTAASEDARDRIRKKYDRLRRRKNR